jgi:D-alanyl-D-alanine carboxypeptidase/D-alanyl-D-alanine-endopeptidase (penicillin-binding protein 4)
VSIKTQHDIQSRHRPPHASLARLASLLCVAACLWSPAARAGDLQNQIEQILGTVSLQDAKVGIHILDARRSRVLAEVDGDGDYLPASNMKLLSSGAALSVLGTDYVFETRLVMDPSSNNQTADVWLIGDGDPALADPAVLIQMEPALDIDAFLSILGEQTATVLDGRPLRNFIVDDRVFDRDFVPESWPIEQLNMAYAAEVAGINIHGNVLRVFPKPSETVSGTPILSVQPKAPWTSFRNRARTVASGQHSAWVARPRPENNFTVFGSVPQGRNIGVEVALHDPALFTGRLLTQAVARRDVTISPPPGINPEAAEDAASAMSDDLATILRAVRRPTESEQPKHPTDIAVIRTPIADIVSRCNKASENLYAEALLKRAGHEVTDEPGSIQNGAAVIRMVMRDLIGPDAASSIRVGDGSGLSRENQVSPEIMSSWLAAIARVPDIGDAFYASLPMPGEDRSTLRTRFSGKDLGTEIRAKSGSINGVRCLSGYVRSRDGSELIAFSILVNDLRRSDHRAAQRLHEQIVDAIDDYVQETVELSTAMPGG